MRAVLISLLALQLGFVTSAAATPPARGPVAAKARPSRARRLVRTTAKVALVAVGAVAGWVGLQMVGQPTPTESFLRGFPNGLFGAAALTVSAAMIGTSGWLHFRGKRADRQTPSQ